MMSIGGARRTVGASVRSKRASSQAGAILRREVPRRRAAAVRGRLMVGLLGIMLAIDAAIGAALLGSAARAGRVELVPPPASATPPPARHGR